MKQPRGLKVPDTNLAHPRPAAGRPLRQQRLAAAAFVLIVLVAGGVAGIAVAVLLGWHPLPL